MQGPSKLTNLKESELLNLILQLPLIQTMKMRKGTQAIKRLMKVAQFQLYEQEQLINNCQRQTYLILILRGQIEVPFSKSKSSNSHRESVIYGKHSNPLIDNETMIYTVKSSSLLCIVREKFILDLFENLLSFPYLAQRLKNLKQNKLFDGLQRKAVNKIAFNLKHQFLPIGTTLYTQQFCSDAQQICKYVYYIVTGQLKICKKNRQHSTQRTSFCVLGPQQIFGVINQESIDTDSNSNSSLRMIDNSYYAIVITENAELYKIRMDWITKYSTNYIEYENKRQKWRQSRMNTLQRNIKINETKTLKEQKYKNGSFLQKETCLHSFYGNNPIQLKKIKESCSIEETKCQNREQYYAKKLDKIMQLKQQRYGNLYDDVVLFPIPLARRFQAKGVQKAHNSPIKKSNKMKTSFNSSIRTTKDTSYRYRAKTEPVRSLDTMLSLPNSRTRKI